MSKVFVHSVSHKDSGLRFEIVLALRQRDAVSQLGALQLVTRDRLIETGLGESH